MVIDKCVLEAMIMFLYHTGEFEACEKVFMVYRKHFYEDELPNRLRVVPNHENDPY